MGLLPETVLSIADAAIDAVVITDAEQRLLHFNRAFARFVGLRERELRGEHRAICHTLLALQSCREGCLSARVFAAGKAQRLHEVKAREGLVVIQAAVPLLMDGKVYAVMETFKDVTAEARMQGRYRDLLEGERKRSEALEREVEMRETQLDCNQTELEEVRSQLLGNFREEVKEGYVRMTADVIALGHAQGAEAEEIGRRLMRDVHTLKGTAGSIGFYEIATLAHAFESACTQGLAARTAFARGLVDRLLGALDDVDEYLNVLASGESDEGAGLLLAARNLEEAREGAGVAPEVAHSRRPVPDSSTRVKTTQLEALGSELDDLVRELLAARPSEPLAARFAEVREKLRALSILPISSLLEPFRRSVRDHARKLGREAILVVKGGDLLLDRTLVEALRGPLTHLVRNAIDHGIESPEARRAKGKSPIGRIVIEVAESNRHVLVSIEDDGNGVSFERIREIAAAGGVLSDVLSDVELLDMIWLPSFSTVSEITETAGRGVGLDAVRSAIDRLSGGIEVKSWAGRGTCFTIRVPLPSTQKT